MSRPKSKVNKDEHAYEPRLKTRDCLGSDCKASIKARYPGFCPTCKARVRMANDNVTEYEAPRGHGLKSGREGY